MQAVLNRPDVVDLRDRVKVVTDPALGKQDADVEITLVSGRSLAAQVRGNRGTPSAPLDDDELDAKFRELVGPVLGAQRTERLLATWSSCESFAMASGGSAKRRFSSSRSADPASVIAISFTRRS